LSIERRAQKGPKLPAQTGLPWGSPTRDVFQPIKVSYWRCARLLRRKDGDLLEGDILRYTMKGTGNYDQTTTLNVIGLTERKVHDYGPEADYNFIFE